MQQSEAAEVLALEALGWLAGQDGMLEMFLGASGASRDELAARAGDPELLAAVLDFLLMDDATVLGFAAASGRTPEAVARARAALPGGALPNWT
jgi:hypothetical protein